MAQQVTYRAASDFYAVEELLTEVQRSARDTVRRFVDREVLPHIGRWWLEGRFPTELIPKLGELGVLGANLPEEYGCAGLDNVSYGLLMQELERGDSGIRSFASVQGALVMYPHLRVRVGGPAPAVPAPPGPGRAGRLLRPHGAHRGKRPRGHEHPGPPHRPRLGPLGHQDVDHQRLHRPPRRGVAKDESDTVRGFLVPTDTPGFSAHDIHTKASMRASVTSELVLEDVEIPEDLALPGAVGLGKALGCLTQARYGIAWGAVGAAVACFEEALSYARERVAFGRPIAATQIIQERLVDMLTKITTSQLLAYRLGQLKDAGHLHYAQVSLAKRHNVRAALEVAREARQVLGAYGITTEYHAMRHAANLESVDTYEGTYDIHTLIVGREITGHEAFGRA
jgi:glutaryl-CoA dehydrogenase